MSNKLIGISGSLLIALGFTQIYSFLSAIVGYVNAQEDFTFVWNYWMLLIFGLGLFILGVCLIRGRNFYFGSAIFVLCFTIFQGFSVYYYQIRVLRDFEKNQPFEWSGTLLSLIGLVIFLLLLIGPKFISAKTDLDLNQNWKNKWRYASGLFSLFGMGVSVYTAITIFKQLYSTSSEQGYLFTTAFDAYFACFLGLVFLLMAILAWWRVSYLLIGVLFGAAIILLTNYLWVTEWIGFAKTTLGITFGKNEHQVFGMQLLMGSSALIASVFAFIAKK
ncbi:hypothetical protein ACP0AK_08580 [Listeria ivanovii]|uniref:Uncharacterized protein n=1 Tax=Listeria ivanovii (strain ATCC BAA-678 / PAM 55) TaxID=881621 RepID=G2ZDL8_LISIP|nr:hypothetical protein [Listeria ivanovii]AHI56634.1 membrane protein [Listeria ivanovii WSLC3009]AIS66051.1 membrane protein [Listeria ivanovii subsp. ivanovii]MBC1760767.1 hypothetical protein [Listeria ivanovii]MBK3913926.1 hypothetical protein [Listeria ivanovii subsp. ivanovii]MBK3921236.1 hypothetical protein [Listeria ivanovii subsp. ivanovii]